MNVFCIHPLASKGSQSSPLQLEGGVPQRLTQGSPLQLRLRRARISTISPGNFAGFTLVELLTVILIIGVLASAMFGIFIQARNAAWKQKARDSARQIATAWNLYLLDNHQFPLTALGTAPNSGYFKFMTTTNTMCILNSNDKIYLEQNAIQRQHGMMDKWGNLFNVQIDTGYGGTVQDPTDTSGATIINANVVVWSLGPYNSPGSYCVASP